MIDEKKLIEAMNDRFNEKFGKVSDTLAEGFMQKEKLIREQPKVGEWIPCSEYEIKDEWEEVLCCDNHKQLLIGNLYDDDKSETGYTCESEATIMFNVVAWMPLPKAYEVEE